MERRLRWRLKKTSPSSRCCSEVHHMCHLWCLLLDAYVSMSHPFTDRHISHEQCTSLPMWARLIIDSSDGARLCVAFILPASSLLFGIWHLCCSCEQGTGTGRVRDLLDTLLVLVHACTPNSRPVNTRHSSFVIRRC